MRNAIEECERAGHAGGLADGLALALDGVDPGDAPGGVAALPVSAVPPGALVIRHDMAAAEGISFVRPGPRRGTPAADPTALAARIGAVRIGVTRRLTAQVVEHLSGRVGGGEPLLGKQLVAAALAAADVAVEAARRCLPGATHPAVVADVHDRLTSVDWELAKLLGASGYVGRNPASGAYVSRLTANCWVPRGRSL
ncbi:acyl-CoA dehydrogenase family protein [Streptantibioticus silvisoli]|uniref:Acyl-CoA dehydrogenase family protein n=1 Tax=Streptantibioticus silvisoli TaxID=2705255 RepID=A0ABT6W2Q7_9ACTN|nr:acyl-CoA dehydrogenase family protein [Streptantibioticus silvisoli]MDI5964579.1 acyl-CoA dehydrogenase family protein [Streptantibioticus silvisoli]